MSLVLPFSFIPDGTDTRLSVLMRPIGGAYDEPAIIDFKTEAASELIAILSLVIVSFAKNPRVSRQVKDTSLLVSVISETNPVNIKGGFAHLRGAA